MTRKLVVFCAAALLAMAAGTAMAADSIQGRLGVTGKIGFIVPADSEAVSTGVVVSRNSDAGFIGGGGLIYGITDNIAGELDITHAGFGAEGGADFDTTNISFGVQYRFLNVPIKHLVPYAGGGLDILINGASGGIIAASDADTVLGIHLSAGVDYFLQRQLALTSEIKGVVAPDADIHDAFGVKRGSFDPDSFSMTFGVRYFFN